MKIVLDGRREVCILGAMTMTKNTNKRVRSYVDSVLNHFDLVKGDECYRDLYEAMERARYYTKPNSEQFIKTMCEAYGCMTKSESERRERLMSGGLMSNVDKFLETL